MCALGEHKTVPYVRIRASLNVFFSSADCCAKVDHTLFRKQENNNTKLIESAALHKV